MFEIILKRIPKDALFSEYGRQVVWENNFSQSPRQTQRRTHDGRAGWHKYQHKLGTAAGQRVRLCSFRSRDASETSTRPFIPVVMRHSGAHCSLSLTYSQICGGLHQAAIKNENMSLQNMAAWNFIASYTTPPISIAALFFNL